MTKEQTAYLISLEERNKALAEEVQALEFEVKDKDKRITETEGELELCEKTHLVVHDENQLNIRRAKTIEAELQQYREPYDSWEEKTNEHGYLDSLPQVGRCQIGKYYHILVVEKESEDE